MAVAYRLTVSTAAPSTAAVELRCPGTYDQGGTKRRCGRLLSRSVPVGQTELVCPRCHSRHTFTFTTEAVVLEIGDRP